MEYSRINIGVFFEIFLKVLLKYYIGVLLKYHLSIPSIVEGREIEIGLVFPSFSAFTFFYL